MDKPAGRQPTQAQVDVSCPACGAALLIATAALGRKVRCPCGVRFIVNSLEEPEDEGGGVGIFDFVKSAALLVMLIAIALGSAVYLIDKLDGNRKPTEVASNSTSSTGVTTTPISLTSGGGKKSLPVTTHTSFSFPVDDLTQGHRNRAADLSPRWNAQQLRLASRKTEAQGSIQQLQTDIQRWVTWRDGLVTERNQTQQKMLRGTIDFASGAETNGGAFARGLAGGLATGLVIEEYNKKIAQGDTEIAKMRGNLSAWQTEQTRLTNLEIQFAGWPRYEGHCYPIVRSVDNASLAQGMGIQPGDMYVFYHDSSLAYVSAAELIKPVDDAKRNGIATVDVGFVRNGTLRKHKAPGGQLLGVVIDLPIQD